MEREQKPKSGIHLLLARYRALFRTPENLNHHSNQGYRSAEQKFLKYALEQRRVEL